MQVSGWSLRKQGPVFLGRGRNRNNPRTYLEFKQTNPYKKLQHAARIKAKMTSSAFTIAQLQEFNSSTAPIT
jgi:hypothetical protein